MITFMIFSLGSQLESFAQTINFKTLKYNFDKRIMAERQFKTLQFRKQIRQEQLEILRKEKRNDILTIQRQQEEFKQTGTYGLQLLKQLGQSEDRNYIKTLQQTYPLSTLYQFLSSTYDNSQFQFYAIRAIESFFYVGYKEKPDHQFIDLILRILTQQAKVDTINFIFLILSDILSDHFKYNCFLIENKKIIPKLIDIFQNYVNNINIKKIIFRVFSQLVQNARWHGDIVLLINPLFNIMNHPEGIQRQIILEIFYKIAQINKEVIAPILYERKLLDYCQSSIMSEQSRVATVLYLKFVILFERILRKQDISNIIEVLSYIRTKDYKIGEGRARYSIYETKHSSMEIINNFIRSNKQDFSQEALLYVSKIKYEMMNDLDSQDVQKIKVVVLNALLAYFLLSGQRPTNQERKMLQQSILKAESSNLNVNNLLLQFEKVIEDQDPEAIDSNYFIINQHSEVSNQSSEMDIQPME